MVKISTEEIETLIHEENQIWLEDITNKINCYEFVCSNLVDMAVQSGESAELVQSQSGENAFKGKGVVYAVITVDYDALKAPLFGDEDYDYICYTDNRNMTSDIWSIRYIENTEGLDNTHLALL